MKRFPVSPRHAVLPLAALAAAAATAPAPLAARSSAVPVEVIRTPGEGIQPQAVADRSGGLHVVYFKGDPRGGDLIYQRRSPGSGRWSDPLRVNSQPASAVALGTIRGGQLALGRGSRVHVVWFGRSRMEGSHGGGSFMYARLSEEGTAFEPQRDLMRFTTRLDGGGSVAADTEGRVYAAWHGNDGKSESEGERRLWVARSSDDGKTFSREAPAWAEPTGACACCSTRAAVDRKGSVFVLYRSATAGVNRDMYLLTSTDRAATFSGRVLDRWVVDACPMSSEALAEGPQGMLAAWETAGQVWFARVSSGAAAGRSPIPAPGAGTHRKHPVLAVNGEGEALLAWTEGTGWNRGGTLAWQLYDAAGRPRGAVGRVDGGIPVWGLPAAAARPDGGFTLLH